MLPGDQARRLPHIGIAGLFFVIFALHVIAWSQYPPDVDPINFVSALHDYNLMHDSPHPPGYPLYVGLGRLSQFLVGRSHAYQLVNLGLLIGTCGFLLRIGTFLRDRSTGILSALIFAVHPLVWGATVIPECYISDAFGGSALVAAGLSTRQRPTLGLTLFIIAELMIGLLRPTSSVLLLPAGLAAIWLANDDWASRRRLIAGAIIGAALATMAAYIMTAELAGGLALYRHEADRVMGASFRGSSILGGAPIATHLAMIAKLFVWFGLFALPAALALGWRVSRQGAAGLGRIAILAGAWILPALGFYSVVYYLKPTYQLIYLPALCLVFAWALLEALKDRPLALGVATAVLAIAAQAFFWFGNEQLPTPLYRLTHSYFNQQDAAWRQLESKVAAVPADQLILFKDNSSLPPQALRLIVPSGIFAVQDPNGPLVLNDHGAWKPASPAMLRRFSGITVTSGE